jgi:hypothetical protein
MSIQTLEAPARVVLPAADDSLVRRVQQTLLACEGYDGQARGKQLWSPWTSNPRPSSADEEVAFVERLRELAELPEHASRAPHRRHNRADITAMVTALRSAFTADRLIEAAPGLSPRLVLSAYADVEQRRRAAETAWTRIVAHPTASTLEHIGDIAARLLHAPVSRLRAIAARFGNDAARIAREVETINQQITTTAALADTLERAMSDTAAPATLRAELGALLYDGLDDGVWGLAAYLPARVGAIVPTRLARLLTPQEGPPFAVPSLH